MMFFGLFELVFISMFSGGFGIPVGIPPAPEDPLMARVAPEECLFYTTWSGMAAPDPASKNHTEQLLAEKEIQFFLAQIESKVKAGLQAMAAAERSPQAEMAAELVPKWGKLLLTQPACIYVTKFEMKEAGPDIIGGAVLHVGDEADEVKRILEEIQSQLVGDEAKQVKIDDGTYHQIRPAPDAPLITWGVRGRYLVVGVGEEAVEALFANARTAPPKWLTDLREQLAVPRVSTVTYANVGQIIELATAAAGDDEVAGVIKLLGFDNLTSYAAVSGLDETGFVSRTTLGVEGEPQGLLAAIGDQPLAADDLRKIPHDTPVAVSLSINAGKVYDTIVEMVGGIDPRALEEFNEGVQEAERFMGVKIREQLIGSLDDAYYIYSAPTEGSLITGWTGVVKVRDAMTLNQVQDTLVEVMRRSFAEEPRAPQVKSTDFNGKTLYFIDVPDDDMPFVPTWCLSGKELIFGLYPQAVRAHLARGADDKSLVDRPDVAQALAADESAFSLTYVDSKKFFKLVYPLLQMGLQAALTEMDLEGVDIDISILPSVGSIAKHLQPSVSVAKRTEAGFEMEVHQTLPGGSIGASLPVMAALLLPAVQAARTAARRAQGANNLKQIALAMHNYHDVFKGLPPAYNTDKDGKPLLSWRVHILPFMEQQALYERFKLDEPWDSEHNKELIPLMPQTLRSPSSMADEGLTTYLGVRGEKTVLAPPKAADNGRDKGVTGARFADITDGTANTILVVEGTDELAVPWTKPDDFTPDKDDPVRGLSGLYGPGFQAAFTDGSVHFLSEFIDPDTLKNLFDRADGNVIPFEDLERR